MSGRLIDISQVLRPELPVWPGDTRFTLAPTWSMAAGAPVNVGRISLSTHSGTHADAPLHYAADGADAAGMALEPFVGPCEVVDLRHVAARRIEPAHLPPLGDTGRVLFKTFARFPADAWRSDFATLAPDTVRHLAAAGVRLIGTDAPSLDPEDSKDMAAHHAARDADLRILEGLVLDAVPAGRYELIALPLRIAGGDAAPVRAVLRTLA
ncbi:arylformamidase [Erythrobacteraceae bacterium CFH 75059]|uniref:arylformamidase n=1 Tax=Qipengyuania thermophila TaxID=2509361 RepID=UPI0010220B0C|nr:arylformamidase [Qipengyuania thermophila]TCD06869.1 arylformamidase [Erythrobacteraceae bacterium CFH 75059]